MNQTLNQGLDRHNTKHDFSTSEHTAVERHHRYAGTNLLPYHTHADRCLYIQILCILILASDIDTWRTTCNQGLTIFRSNYAADAESRRARRHAASTSSSGATCHICSRVCASDFGLRSHLQSHTQLTSSTPSSS